MLWAGAVMTPVHAMQRHRSAFFHCELEKPDLLLSDRQSQQRRVSSMRPAKDGEV